MLLDAHHVEGLRAVHLTIRGRMYNRSVLFDLNDLGKYKSATVVIVGSFAVCVGMGQVVHRKAGDDDTGGGGPEPSDEH